MFTVGLKWLHTVYQGSVLGTTYGFLGPSVVIPEVEPIVNPDLSCVWTHKKCNACKLNENNVEYSIIGVNLHIFKSSVTL